MSQIYYGIWIKGTGWLKTPKGIVSFDVKKIADDTARRVGGEVRFIDESLEDLELNIKSLEGQKKWYEFWRKV